VSLLAKDVSKRHRPGAHPPHPSSSPHSESRIGPGTLRSRASLSRRCGWPVGVGFSAVPQVASPASSSRRQQQSTPLSRSALRARDALVLEHLPLADALASTAARRLFPLVEREDLIQVAREALVRSAPRCRAGEPAGPYLRRCITGALQHHLRNRVRLVRISRREHEKGTWPLGHTSLDAPFAGEHSLLDELAAPAAEPALDPSITGPALEQLVEQLPAFRPRPCGSPSSRGSPCEPPRRSCRSARWRCSGPRRWPSLPCVSSCWGRAEAPTGFLPCLWQELEDRHLPASCPLSRGWPLPLPLMAT
jgi:RNA polymerase sigma-B factor